jgi:ADP-heptose:LPS heptosyltransferase
MRYLTFYLLNFLGGILFYCLRLVRLLPPVVPFEKEKINKIVIFRPDMVGDVVLTTPLIKNTRENFPDAHITIVVSAITKDIVAGNPYLDEIIVTRGTGLNNLLKDFPLIKLLRKRKFDLALMPFPALSCNFFAFLTGATHRIGYGDRGSRFLLTKSLTLAGFEVGKKHIIDVALDLLRVLDCEIRSRDRFVSVYEDGEKKAQYFFLKNNLNPQDKVVIIHPGARKAYQLWPTAKFAELADKLIEELKVKIIMLAGPADGNLVNDTIKKMRNPAVIASGFELKDTVSLIKRGDLFIGHSTGTTHIADALGTLTVMLIAFFNSGDSPKIWGLSNPNNIMVSNDTGCCGCIPSDCRDYHCIRDISVEKVFTAAKEQIDKIRAK